MAKKICGDPDLLTPEQLATLFKALPAFAQWMKAVQDRAMDLARTNKLPGFKLVQGRSQRKWMDEDVAFARMVKAGMDRDELYDTKFISVAAAEKILGKAAFRTVATELVTRTEGKPTLAPLSDKRAALIPGAEFVDS